MILFTVFLVGLTALVVAAALVSIPCGFAAFGMACMAICVWPLIRALIARGL